MVDAYRIWKQKKDFQIRDGVMVRFFDQDGTTAWSAKRNNFSVEMIEDCIRSYKYNEVYDPYRNIREREVEYGNFPWFIDAICFYMFVYETIPSPSEFFRVYADGNFSKWDDEYVFHNGKRYNTSAVKGRAFRSYPSLIRDIHFYHLSKESGLFDRSLYSFKYDTEDRVDVVLFYNPNRYNIRMRTNTKLSNEFDSLKDYRHTHSTLKGIPIDLPIDLGKQNNRRVGDFRLYSDFHLGILNEMIRSNCMKKAA